LSNQMEIDTARFIEYAPKDFFYMTVHDPTPPSLEGGEKTKWEPDPGVQPAPSWMAGLWRTVTGGVEVLDVEPARATFRIRAGTKEPDPNAERSQGKATAARAHELDADDAHRVLFALTLGASEAKHPRGLVTDGKIALAVSGAEHQALLTSSEEGALAIVPAKELATVPPRTDAVELPLLLDDGKEVKAHTSSRVPPSADPHAPAGRARAALGLAPNGRVFVARATGSTVGVDALATALKHAGCTKAVLLDRGSGSHGALFRAGTTTPPRSRYEESTLYAMGKALLPRGFRFEAVHPVEQAPPKKK
ncbi:MAG: phosphodiester glycosidase family protein, partial [Deltaproteobacteria bacterium]|nr:phosphodiester glycosidase family protein [Deltaproteobacteria bacterium]